MLSQNLHCLLGLSSISSCKFQKSTLSHKTRFTHLHQLGYSVTKFSHFISINLDMQLNILLKNLVNSGKNNLAIENKWLFLETRVYPTACCNVHNLANIPFLFCHLKILFLCVANSKSVAQQAAAAMLADIASWHGFFWVQNFTILFLRLHHLGNPLSYFIASKAYFKFDYCRRNFSNTFAFKLIC